MALEYTDWGLSPEEAVASRKKALEDFTNVAQPMEKERQAMERGKLASDTYAAASEAARQGASASPVLAKAQLQAAELLPQQAQREQDLAYQGAMQKEDILSSKQGQAVSNYARNTAEYKDKIATQLANKAFEMGYSSKELSLSNDAFLADRGLTQMYADLQAGRITTKEVQELSYKLQAQAQQMKADLDTKLAELKGQLELDLANKNIEAAKKRVAELTEKMKATAETAAKAQSMGAMISGGVSIAGGIVGGILGGPGGAVAGAGIGSELGNMFKGLF